MKKLLFFLVLLNLSKAFALTGQICGPQVSPIQFNNLEVYAFRPPICQELKKVENGLKVISLGLGVSSIASLCGVVSAPLALGLGIASIVTANTTLALNMYCDPDETPSAKDFQVFICAQLTVKGIECDNNIRLELGHE